MVRFLKLGGILLLAESPLWLAAPGGLATDGGNLERQLMQMFQCPLPNAILPSAPADPPSRGGRCLPKKWIRYRSHRQPTNISGGALPTGE
ncbi:uncharacterized protein EI90DRAFT_3061725 [Cantharellus anzutake]|uniref:uncharacterized protein n=1 Tax=Cantharellus anzutake TaxID=1750568 RepID=UPI001902E534|nr:uncharacterized protein EI90DRAFT_3061725 [Cantharellus anzutake]KAF8329733.1 hypothetical protein EI90DRAFT_3061725 [Cantharellus anzutake]